MKPAIAVFAVTASAFALPAAAQMSTSAFYVGAGVGQSKAKDWCSGTGGTGITCDDKKTAWKAFGGYQFNRYLSAELGYANLALPAGPIDQKDVRGRRRGRSGKTRHRLRGRDRADSHLR